MSDFEVQVVDILKTLDDKFNGILVLIGLLFVIICLVLLIWSFLYDKKEAEKREKKFKDYVKEEINNARK